MRRGAWKPPLRIEKSCDPIPNSVGRPAVDMSTALLSTMERIEMGRPRDRSGVQLAMTVALTLLTTGGVYAQAGKSKLLNPNLATTKELAALSHLNEELAKQIVEQRPFLEMGALDKLLAQSLKAEARTDLYRKMFIPLNLNKAKRETILLIPGVGKRLVHEFEEYRPYPALPQFRREIGKYVDKDEVARLEQYVFVPLNLNTASEKDFATIPGVGKRMVHEFMEYRPYQSMKQFRREIGKYVSEKEVARLERYVFLK